MVSSIENSKLTALRDLMTDQGIDCYVCFHMDAHNSEYIASHDERVAFISGFTGSNGLCVVTQEVAYMWTDGRYYISAV